MNGGLLDPLRIRQSPSPTHCSCPSIRSSPPTDKRMGARETDPILTLRVPPAMNRPDCSEENNVVAWLILGYLCSHPDAKDTAEDIGRWWLRGKGLDIDTESVCGSLAYLVKQGRPPVAAPVAVSLTLSSGPSQPGWMRGRGPKFEVFGTSNPELRTSDRAVLACHARHAPWSIYGHATRSVEPEAEVPFVSFPSAWRAWRRFSLAFS